MTEKKLKLTGQLTVKETGEIELHGSWLDLKEKLSRFDGQPVVVTISGVKTLMARKRTAKRKAADPLSAE